MIKKKALLLSLFLLFQSAQFSYSSSVTIAPLLNSQLSPDEIEASILPSVTNALALGDSSNINYLGITSCDLYSKFNFKKSNSLNYSIFLMAYKGYLVMLSEGLISNNRYLTVMDFELSSNQRRLWVLDIQNTKIVLNELVSHGRNSGEEYARSFSNKPESFKSSLGFYVTGTPYLGKNDYSLRLHGAEEGFNDNALERGIVMHGADYVCSSYIKCNQRLGRSQGCPAVPTKVNKWLIDLIQGGSCLFIYYPDKQYLKKSEILSAATPEKEFFLNSGYALTLP